MCSILKSEMKLCGFTWSYYILHLNHVFWKLFDFLSSITTLIITSLSHWHLISSFRTLLNWLFLIYLLLTRSYCLFSILIFHEVILSNLPLEILTSSNFHTTTGFYFPFYNFSSKDIHFRRKCFHMNKFNYIEYNNHIYITPTLAREAHNRK